ncbi:MAG TPA: S41 family peptidase [Candidatus Limiplasma sp.]|nr:S41 family peptidase [Candidatus Limiplasma sp.]HRX08616.1 S41 family peptidase [Candidatus Limiplasma sp.]
MMKMNSRRTLWIALITAVVLLIAAAAPFASAQLFAPYQTKDDTVTISRAEYERYQQYAELDKIAEYIQNYYYQDADFDTLLEGAKAGMVAALDDPYSFYYTAEQFHELWEDDEGEYAGIGIQISASYLTELCTIIRTFDGSPAEEAGLRKGDILVKVEDLDVTVYTLQEAVDIMRGVVGESVHVSVLRDKEILEFDIVRAVVHVNRVSSKMLDSDVGYIQLYEFAGDCAVSFKQHLDALLAQGMKALIFDLRDNPGGWVQDAVDIAGNFIDGDVVTYLEDKSGYQEFYNASDGKIELPIVILVNEYSASSSEILSGALQDYGLAKVVGVQSFGKGVVQSVIALDPYDENTDGMQVTSAQYYTPNGNSLHKVGITPDVVVEMPEDQKNEVFQFGDLTDTQLAEAYRVALEQLGE